MRSLIKIIFFIVILQGCKSQKNTILEKPVIDNSFEKFDSEEYSKKSNYKKHSPENIHIVNDENSFSVLDNHGNALVFYSKSDTGFLGYDYSVNPIIGIQKEFYPNGNIKTKALTCVFGFTIGKCYNYFENGGLDSVVDTDAGYDFNFEKVFQYCRDNGIELKNISGYHLSINKGKARPDNQAVWVISYPDYSQGSIKNIKLAGSTGTLIDTWDYPLRGGNN